MGTTAMPRQLSWTNLELDSSDGGTDGGISTADTRTYSSCSSRSSRSSGSSRRPRRTLDDVVATSSALGNNSPLHKRACSSPTPSFSSSECESKTVQAHIMLKQHNHGKMRADEILAAHMTQCTLGPVDVPTKSYLRDTSDDTINEIDELDSLDSGSDVDTQDDVCDS